VCERFFFTKRKLATGQVQKTWVDDNTWHDDVDVCTSGWFKIAKEGPRWWWWSSSSLALVGPFFSLRKPCTRLHWHFEDPSRKRPRRRPFPARSPADVGREHERSTGALAPKVLDVCAVNRHKRWHLEYIDIISRSSSQASKPLKTHQEAYRSTESPSTFYSPRSDI